MTEVNRAAKFVLSTLVAVVTLAGTLTRAHAEAGHLHFTFYKTHGVIEGAGSLFYRRTKYRLTVAGIPADSLGVARADYVGAAPNLRNPSDILGVYSAREGGSAVAVGTKIVQLKNPSGAMLDVHGVNAGQMSLNLEGMMIQGRGWGGPKQR